MGLMIESLTLHDLFVVDIIINMVCDSYRLVMRIPKVGFRVFAFPI